MNMNVLRDLLTKMDIEVDELEMNATLGDDLVMDSQEIVELYGLIEENLGIKLKDGEIVRTNTVAEVIEILNYKTKLAENTDLDSQKSPFEFERADEIIINGASEEFIEAIWDLDRWEERLEHIKKIEVRYNDGKYQEFLMEVDTGKNQVSVRSIRRKEKNKIDFFQPEPPKYLEHHTGSWIIKGIGNNQTHVTLIHRWNLKLDRMEEIFGTNDKNHVASIVNEQLHEHAITTLNQWKRIMEKGGIEG